ncbi:MAG: PqqD family peptide modification chaperone [Candidatus Binataceae bacterium]
MRPTHPIRITRDKTRCAGTRELAALRRDFERQSFVRFPAMIDRKLMRVIAAHLEHADFGRVEHRGFGRDLSMAPNVASAALNFLLNDPALFDAIRTITGSARIGSFAGRVYRVADQGGLGLEWHDDAVRDRLVALSINVGSGTYRGGRLEIRDRTAGRIVAQVKNRGLGSAILFRIGPALEHRNSPVTGSIAKTAFAGWFMARPDYPAAVRRQLNRTAAARVRKKVQARGSTLAARAKIPPAIAWRRIGDETLVIDLRSGSSYRLDETGGKIWKMLAKGNGPAAIARALAAEYAIAATTVRDDIDLMLRDLARSGLIGPLDGQRRPSSL